MSNLHHARTTGRGHRTGKHMHVAYLRMLDARVQAGLSREFFSRRLALRDFLANCLLDLILG
eukprot:4313614-Alexandrium_andersonii.AAC.1